MSKQYDLSEILNLVEKREELTLKLIAIERPTLIINSERGAPLYKITMSHVGDFLIFINTYEQDSLAYMLTKVNNPEEFYDLSDFEVAATYIRAANIHNRDRGEDGEVRPPRPFDEEPAIQWRLVVALPLEKCIQFAELMQNIFGDDIYNNKKTGEV